MVAYRQYIASEVAAFHRVRDRFGPFSNMASGFPIEVGGVRSPSSEALYQALRFPHLPDFQSAILDQSTPILSKRHAYIRISETRPDWDQVKVNVMRYVLRAKVGTAQGGLLDLLRGTGETPIVEISNRDDFWGARPVGAQLIGRNVLGRLLMELRLDLRDHPSGTPILLEPRFPDPVLCGSVLEGEMVGPESSPDLLI
jgi:type I restriction enzyme, S subunit